MILALSALLLAGCNPEAKSSLPTSIPESSTSSVLPPESSSEEGMDKETALLYYYRRLLKPSNLTMSIKERIHFFKECVTSSNHLIVFKCVIGNVCVPALLRDIANLVESDRFNHCFVDLNLYIYVRSFSEKVSIGLVGLSDGDWDYQFFLFSKVHQRRTSPSDSRLILIS